MEKLKKIGIVFGCYIPLHEGHKLLIEDALAENDEVIVVVCGYDDDRGKDYIPFKSRYGLLCEKYKNEERICVIDLDDKELGLTGLFDYTSWKIWCRGLFENLYQKYGYAFNFYKSTVTWYTGEWSYAEKIGQVFPQDNFKIYSRNNISVSGTKIRNDFEKYNCFIDEDFKEWLVQNGKVKE